ncbi:hypothetical protein G6F35_019105 [Rhizopus arrhizus]|nr:hypothetical protein G6F35_019105 [Rhizopus arrhizus]
MVPVVLPVVRNTLLPLTTLPITRGVPPLNCRPVESGSGWPRMVTLERMTPPFCSDRMPRSMRVAPA